MWDEIIFNSFASVNVLCTCSLYNVARVNIPRRIMNRIRKQRIKMAATMYVLGSPCTVLCAKSWGITVVDEELESVNKFHYKVQSCFDIMPYCYIAWSVLEFFMLITTNCLGIWRKLSFQRLEKYTFKIQQYNTCIKINVINYNVY